MGVLIAGELGSNGLVLFLQLGIGFVGLLEKLRKRQNNVFIVVYIKADVFNKQQWANAHLAVGSVLFQMNLNTLGNLKKPTPLSLQSVHVGLQQQTQSSVTGQH